jgi:hypothetical protein
MVNELRLNLAQETLHTRECLFSHFGEVGNMEYYTRLLFHNTPAFVVTEYTMNFIICLHPELYLNIGTM